MKRVVFLFLMVTPFLFGEIRGINYETIFKDNYIEGKVRTLTENIEAVVVIDDILKSEKLEETEKGLLLKKKEYFKSIYENNFEIYYNKTAAEEIINRDGAPFEKAALNQIIKYGKAAAQYMTEISEMEKSDGNYIFYVEYFGELRRLILLFPKITSEIEPLSKKEKQGFELNKREAALTFDDGPSENTRELLAVLEKEGIKATFFIQGSKLENNSSHIEILKKEIAAGNEIGVHSMTHIKLKNMDEKTVYREIVYPKELIFKLSGVTPKIYRTPFGLRDAAALKEIEKIYDGNILWNIDSQDWRSNFSAEQVEARVLKLAHLYNGGIVLFHDTNKKSTAVMEKILIKMKLNGFKFKTVSECYK